MEDFISSAVEYIASADVYLAAIAGVLLALAGVAKLTKTEKDDKYIAMAIAGMNKLKGLVSKLKPTAKK